MQALKQKLWAKEIKAKRRGSNSIQRHKINTIEGDYQTFNSTTYNKNSYTQDRTKKENNNVKQIAELSILK